MSKGRGKKIAIKFDKPLLGDVSGNEGAFTISGMEKSPLFYGEPKLRQYAVEKVERYPLAELWRDDFSGQLDGVEVGGNGVVLDGEIASSNEAFYSDTPTTNDRDNRAYASDVVFAKTTKITHILFNGKLNSGVTYRFFIEAKDGTTSRGTTIAEKSIVAAATETKLHEIELDTPVTLLEDDRCAIGIQSVGFFGVRFDTATAASEYIKTHNGGLFAATPTGTWTVGAGRAYGMGIMVESAGAYSTPGTYTATTPADTLPENPRLKWAEDLPAGTSITAEYTVTDSGTTPPETWAPADDNDILTITPTEGYFLWLRFTLSTEDTAVTPTLLSVWLEEAEAPPDTILLTMTEAGRFNNVQGDLTVAYNQALGNLAGVRPVESFEASFTPTDLEPSPVHEHIVTVRGEPLVSFIPVSYEGYPDHAEHTIAATAGPINIAFIHVDDIPP